MIDLKGEVLASIAQGACFLVGLVLSLALGMLLAKLFHSIPGLLIATVGSGTGLLAAAALSQSLRDYLLEKRFAESERARAQNR